MTLTEGLLLVLAFEVYIIISKLLSREELNHVWSELWKMGIIVGIFYIISNYWQVILGLIVILWQYLFVGSI